jgi:hypothetical protein
MSNQDYNNIMDRLTDAEPFNAYGEWVWNIDDCYNPEPDGNGLYHCDAAWSKHGEEPWVYGDGFGKTHEDAMIAATARVRDEMEKQLHCECRRIEHRKEKAKPGYESIADKILRSSKDRVCSPNVLERLKARHAASKQPATPEQKLVLAKIAAMTV